MPIDQPPQICRTMEVTPGQQLVIEVEVGEAKQLRSFVVPGGVRHLTVCLNRAKSGVTLLRKTTK